MVSAELQADLKERLAAMFDLIDTMVSIVRGIASTCGRRPRRSRMKEAIEWQAQQFQDRTGIAVDYQSLLTMSI